MAKFARRRDFGNQQHQTRFVRQCLLDRNPLFASVEQRSTDGSPTLDTFHSRYETSMKDRKLESEVALGRQGILHVETNKDAARPPTASSAPSVKPAMALQKAGSSIAVSRKPVGEYWLANASLSRQQSQSSEGLAEHQQPVVDDANEAKQRAVSVASNATFIVKKLGMDTPTDEERSRSRSGSAVQLLKADSLGSNDVLASYLDSGKLSTGSQENLIPPKLEIKKPGSSYLALPGGLPTPVTAPSAPPLEDSQSFVAMLNRAGASSSSISTESFPTSRDPNDVFRVCRDGNDKELFGLLSTHGEQVFYHPPLGSDESQPYTPNLVAIAAGRLQNPDKTADLGSTLFCALSNALVRSTPAMRDRVARFFADAVRQSWDRAANVETELSSVRAKLAEEQARSRVRDRNAKEELERAREEAERTRKEDVERVTRGFEALRTEVRTFADERVAALQGELQVARVEHETAMKDARKEHESALKSLKHDHEAALLSTKKDHEASLKAVKADNEAQLKIAKQESADRVADLQHRIHDLQKEADKSKKEHHDRVQELQKEVDRARKEGHERSNELSKELERARKQADEERTRHEKALDEIRKKLEVADKDLKKAQEEQDKAKEKTRKAEQEKSEAVAQVERKLTEQLAKHASEMERLGEELRVAKKEREDARAAASQVEKLERILDSMEREIDGLRKEKESLERDKERILEDMTSLEGEKERLGVELLAASDRETQLAREIDDLQGACQDLRDQMAERERQAEAEAQLARDTAEAEALAIRLRRTEGTEAAVQTDPTRSSFTDLVQAKLDEAADRVVAINPSPEMIALVVIAILAALVAVMVGLVKSGAVDFATLGRAGTCVAGRCP